MPYKEHTIQKRYWHIAELAERYSCTTSLIRFYEREFGLIIKRSKYSHNQRLYTKSDVLLLDKIYALVHVLKLTLSGARQWLDAGWPVPNVPLQVLNNEKIRKAQIRMSNKRKNRKTA